MLLARLFLIPCQVKSAAVGAWRAKEAGAPIDVLWFRLTREYGEWVFEKNQAQTKNDSHQFADADEYLTAMTENLPQFISIVFILTTFLTVGFLFYAIKQTVYDTTAAKAVIFLIPFYLFFQAMLSLGGFYENSSSIPPRIPLFAVLPAI